MDKFEFYKELYHKENDRKVEITNSYMIPVVIISALASGFYFLLTSYTYSVSTISDWIFICLLSFTAVSILISCYSMIRAFNTFRSFDYKGIPYVDELENWYNELLKYYKNDKWKTDEAFKEGIISYFIETVKFNASVNDKKHGFIYKSKQYSAIGLTFLFLSFAPYLYIYFSKPKYIEKAELIFEKDKIKAMKPLRSKIDSISNIINKLKPEIMNAKKEESTPSPKEESTPSPKVESTPPTPPKVRTYSEGGKIPAKPNDKLE